MTTNGKIWGTSKAVVITPFAELHHIKVKPSSYCSEHLHSFKSNLFYILKGAMIVKVWKDNGLIDETILTEGMSTSVGPNEKHQFITPKLADIQLLDPLFKEDDFVEAIELYYPEPINQFDIKRNTQGGSLYTV